MRHAKSVYGALLLGMVAARAAGAGAPWNRGRRGMSRAGLLITIAALAGLFNCRPARAQWVVVDPGAIAQAIEEVAQLEQEVETAREQLSAAQDQVSQAKSAYNAMTGTRGMQGLLASVNRNYLPRTPGDVSGLLSGSAGAYAGLSSQVDTGVSAHAVLSDAAVGSLGDAGRQAVGEDRRRLELAQAMTGSALQSASDRFANLQALIDAIGTATDPKAIADLQARIQVEQAMLANEALKDRLLAQQLEAAAAIRRQQLKEQAVADIGRVRDLPPLGLLP